MNLKELKEKINLLIDDKNNLVKIINDNNKTINELKVKIKDMKFNRDNIVKSLIVLALLCFVKYLNPVNELAEIICYFIMASLSVSNIIYNYVKLKKSLKIEKNNGDYEAMIDHLINHNIKCLDSIDKIDREINDTKYFIDNYDEYLLKLENEKRKLEDKKRELERIVESRHEKRGSIKKVNRIKLYRR